MPQDALAQVDRYLSEHQGDGLAGLKEFLAIPSVSALSAHEPDLRRTAAWLAERWRAAGFENVAILETGAAAPGGGDASGAGGGPAVPAHPAVYAEWLHAPGRPTALLYGHYDVQPADPLPGWTSPPFAPALRDGRLFARGASDDKGQVWMHVLAAQALLRTAGALPINLKVLIEGEEEVGSRHLGALVEAERDRLAADVVVISDSGFYRPGLPAIVCGLRGLAALEMTVAGPRRDLHSGDYGGAVQNPLHALAALIAGLHDGDGRVAVPGFYDGVREPGPSDRAALARLPFDEAEYREELGVPEAFGEPGYTTLERCRVRPTVECNGLWGGFQGEGSKTVIPAQAHAKLTCRLVPDQDPRHVLACLQADLERRCPRGVRVEVAPHGGSEATVISPDSAYIRAADRALRRVFGVAPAYTRMGGSIGVVPALERVLRAPVVLMGFGLPGDHIHSPDESLDMGNYERGQRAIAAYWLELGSQAQG